MTDPTPVLRLWQSVVLQAVHDASHHNPHQDEAKRYMASRVFVDLCDVLDLNSATLRAMEGDVYGQFRKALGGKRYD
jgi:hypothetical protein